MPESFNVSIGVAVLSLTIALGSAGWVLYTQNKLKLLFRGKHAKDLEASFVEIASVVKGLEKKIRTNEEALFLIQSRLPSVLQKVGIIRFNPFEDAGGDQSFAIALLDAENNGVVFSSLYSREGVRVFAKPIKAGSSSYHLSKEEDEAINRALRSENLKENGKSAFTTKASDRGSLGSY